MMAKAGCWLISWGIESANEMILKRARKGYKKEQAFAALKWAQDRRDQELGLLHHRPARRNRGVDPGNDRTTPRNCRWISPFSILLRPIPARPSSTRWWKTTGSDPARSGKRSTWISRPCWTMGI